MAMRPTRSGPSRRRSDGCRAASGHANRGATVRSPPEAPRLRTPSCPESTYRIAYGPHPTARVPPPRNKRTDSKGRQRPRRSNRAYLARDVREIPLHRAPPPSLSLSLFCFGILIYSSLARSLRSSVATRSRGIAPI
ncbi:hypothetical protein BHE74_00025482 [Ensete ventricosum]|nr:hypothetical protein BHE74_00025482 [Ensete ventricosum]RZR89442.1 hypothetical protein BHM03_00017152 [Ensete ventricosum]